MGFLDKAVKAAATAKVQFDDLRETRAAASVTPVEAGPLGDHEQQVIHRARACGAPDPTLLLTRHEATDVTGQPLGGPHLIYGDDSIGVRFEATGRAQQRWRVEVSAFHGTDDDPEFDAGAHWSTYLADLVADDARPVPGLGDAALQRERDLFVLADPLLLMIAVQTPEPHGDQERAVAVARHVVARLLT
jgi:hypothetical protein